MLATTRLLINGFVPPSVGHFVAMMASTTTTTTSIGGVDEGQKPSSSSSTSVLLTNSNPISTTTTTTRLFHSPQQRNPRQNVILLACGCFNPPTYMHLRMFELARDYLHRRTNYRVIEGIISVVNDAYHKKDLVSADHRLSMVRLAVESSKWIRADDWEFGQTQWCPTVKVLRHIRSVQRQKQILRQANNESTTTPSGKTQQSSPASSSTTIVEEGLTSLGPVPYKKSKMDGGNGGPIAQSSTESSGVGSIISDHVHVQTPSIVPKSASIDVGSMGSLETEEPVRIMLLCGSDLLQSFEVPNLWAPEDMEEIVRDFGIVVITRSGYDPRKVVYESDLLTRYEKNIHHVTEWIANDISSTKIRRALKRAESVRYLLADKVLDYIFQHKLYGCARRTIDILSSPSSLLASNRDAEHRSIDPDDQAHCSYHPQYRQNRKSITDDSDYDNLAPCPCPLTTSASVPNATIGHLLGGGGHHAYRNHPTAAATLPRSTTMMDKSLSLDVPMRMTTNPDPNSTPSAAAATKPTKFPTELEPPTGGAVRTSARPTAAIKSALKSPPTVPSTIQPGGGNCGGGGGGGGTRQRAVSYHSDLSRSTVGHRSTPITSSRTMEMGESSGIIEETIPFGSVSTPTTGPVHHKKRSLSNLSELHSSEYCTRTNGRNPETAEGSTTTARNGADGSSTGGGGGATVASSDPEEVTWHYNPELTKSLPNLRIQRQTPPRHVRILDKGVCFTHDDREAGLSVVDDRGDATADESSAVSNLANNLVVRVKQLKLTMSPETTV